MANNNIIKNGFKPDSVKNLVFGAGVLFRNFTYGTHYTQTFDKYPKGDKEYYILSGGPSGSVNYTLFTGDSFDSGSKYYEKYTGFGGDKIGATKEGTKVSITPEYTDIEVDGVLVKMENLTHKTGEKAVIEAVVIDMSPENISLAVNGSMSYSDTDEFSGAVDTVFIKTKSDISQGDYITNLALIARRLDDQKLTAVIFKKALCTSGFEMDMKNKNISGSKYAFEAYAEMSDQNTDTLPVVILSERSL